MLMAKRAPTAASILVVLVTSLTYVAADPPPRDIFDFGKDPLRPATKPTAATKPAPTTKPAAPVGGLAPVVAAGIQIVADDFVADIHHNGKLVPAENRKLQAEIF